MGVKSASDVRVVRVVSEVDFLLGEEEVVVVVVVVVLLLVVVRGVGVLVGDFVAGVAVFVGVGVFVGVSVFVGLDSVVDVDVFVR